MKMTKREAIQSVLDGLQALIRLGHYGTVEREFKPTHDPDSDDDVIRAGQEQVKRLRKFREEFEDLLLGEIK